MSGGIVLSTAAEACLRSIGDWGYPESAMHYAHRRFFNRHQLIEAHSPGKIRVTAAARTLLTKIGATQ